MSSHNKIKPLQNGANQQLQNALVYILNCQLDSGAIPWFKNGKLDPWDHSEAIMALNVAGHFKKSQAAINWLIKNQNTDGSWYACYFAEDDRQLDDDRHKIDTNFVAYPATALWHYWLCSGDKKFAKAAYPSIKKAIDFICTLQTNEGDIQWALSSQKKLPKDALLTACSSILRSLECAIYLAELIGDEPQHIQHWQQAHNKLADAIKNKPWRFDRSWPSKNRFSMDWFYPVLSGAYNQQEAQLRLQQGWNKFVVESLGCRCVSDEPWVTIAESCELVIALIAAGEKHKAEALFLKLLRWQDKDGGFWTGYQFKNKDIWPQEKPSWTTAAIVLAADALWQLSPASKLFTSSSCELFAPQYPE